MRVLLSGAFHPHFETLPDSLRRGLAGIGHRVEVFDHRARLVPGRLRRRAAWLERLDRAALNARFLRAVRRLGPDLVLVNQGMVIEPRTIEAARRLGARCVNWFSDYPAEFEAGLVAAPAYDAMFLASSYAAARHRDAGHAHAGWLPFACDPAIHRPGGAAPAGGPVPPIVFVGSYYPERHILLRFLRGLPVGVWGPGWERAGRDPHLATMIRGGAIGPDSWRAMYSAARVVLNIHYGCLGPEEAGGGLANTRVFEILACGAYQIVDRQADVLRLFGEGEHLAAFSGGDELRARVEAALRDDDRRARVAQQGRAAVLAGHTYADRARILADPHAPGFALPGRLAAAAAGGAG